MLLNVFFTFILAATAMFTHGRVVDRLIPPRANALHDCDVRTPRVDCGYVTASFPINESSLALAKIAQPHPRSLAFQCIQQPCLKSP